LREDGWPEGGWPEACWPEACWPEDGWPEGGWAEVRIGIEGQHSTSVAYHSANPGSRLASNTSRQFT